MSKLIGKQVRGTVSSGDARRARESLGLTQQKVVDDCNVGISQKAKKVRELS